MPGLIAAAVLCTAPLVHDGDTIRCGAEKIRIAAIDAPELPGSPRCRAPRKPSAWCDYAAGERARVALVRQLAGRRVTFVRRGKDRFGRTVATVFAGNTDIGQWLIARGLARRWP